MISVNVDYLGNINYFEYILTGFYQLKKERFLSFHYVPAKYNVSLRKAAQCTNIPIFKNRGERLSLPGNLCLLTIQKDNAKIKIALDCMDTPWEFYDDYLEQVDLYYKFQCPVNLEDGYFELNQQNKYPFSEKVMNNLHKISPLCLPRPLSRTMNFKKNLEILEEYKTRRLQAQVRNVDLLVYLGNAGDSAVYKEIDHPHRKRLECMVRLQELRDKKGKKYHIVFNKPSPKNSIASYTNKWDEYYEKLEPYKETISDKMYRGWCFTSKATLNIAGLRGSVPFRYFDAFLSNMLIITDHPMVKWYISFAESEQIIDIGKMGYEILTEKDFCNRISTIEYLTDSIDQRYKSCIFDFYDNYLTPRVLANKILNDIENIVLQNNRAN